MTRRAFTVEQDSVKFLEALSNKSRISNCVTVSSHNDPENGSICFSDHHQDCTISNGDHLTEMLHDEANHNDTKAMSKGLSTAH